MPVGGEGGEGGGGFKLRLGGAYVSVVRVGGSLVMPGLPPSCRVDRRVKALRELGMGPCRPKPSTFRYLGEWMGGGGGGVYGGGGGDCGNGKTPQVRPRPLLVPTTPQNSGHLFLP